MHYNEDALLYLALASAPGMNCERYARLLEDYDSPQEIWDNISLGNPDIAYLGQELVSYLASHRNIRHINEYVMQLEEKGVSAVCRGTPDYPEALVNIQNPPPVLYYKGDFSLAASEYSIGVVGSRRCTYYGKSTAARFSRELAKHGLPIISGLARGIDTQAHKGALGGGGKTIAVLGCGLDIIYPPENKALYEEIAERGLMLSEFPLGTPPIPSNFPRRNRIISALSRVLLVVEAALKSGALITANCAIDQGRDVFFIPGNIDSPASAGTNMMIKEGLPAALGPEDILEHLGIRPEEEKEEKIDLDERELRIASLLLEKDMSIDELCGGTLLSAAELGSLLTMLEMRGIVTQLPGKLYTLNNKKQIFGGN
ncbi:MAG: DNA-protecting protein DprA [Christensenellaceae bacterium]|jgi:DNA protecting protein dprA|nr:DNA-protecting protein DprA [Christensenellaceae bacterium]MBS6565171.1 DNA-processing protein DprA [Clostridiales bacterium]